MLSNGSCYAGVLLTVNTKQRWPKASSKTSIYHRSKRSLQLSRLRFSLARFRRTHVACVAEICSNGRLWRTTRSRTAQGRCFSYRVLNFGITAIGSAFRRSVDTVLLRTLVADSEPHNPFLRVQRHAHYVFCTVKVRFLDIYSDLQRKPVVNCVCKLVKSPELTMNYPHSV